MRAMRIRHIALLILGIALLSNWAARNRDRARQAYLARLASIGEQIRLMDVREARLVASQNEIIACINEGHKVGFRRGPAPWPRCRWCTIPWGARRWPHP